MSTPSQKILTYLQQNNIPFQEHTHEAVFTCEAAARVAAHVPGLQAKTLILRDSKLDKFFMIIMPAAKRLDMNALRPLLNAKKLSFAKPEHLEELLKVTPGSCSPFGLIFDQNQKLEIHIEEDILNSPTLNFHPNDNRSSLEIAQENFQKFLSLIPHQHRIITL